MRAIDRLKAAISMAPTYRSIDLPNGEEFGYYAPPVTLSQRAKAQKLAPGDDSTGFALQLLVMLAIDENGQKMFTSAEVAEFNNDFPASVVETLLLQLLTWEQNPDAEKLEMKSSKAATSQGAPPVSANVSGAGA